MGLFGPSKSEIWEQFSKEINAEFIEGGFFKNSKIKAHVENWTIILDTYTVSTGKSSTTYTRMRAPFISTDDLYFKIYNSGIFSGLGKLLGMQDILIGNEYFDNNFIVKGNNENKIKELLSNDRIRALIEAQPKISLEIKDNKGFFDVNELYFKVPGVIKDVNSLKYLFELFREILNTLCNIGSSERITPNVEL